jgi:ATP adenylyltransferase
MKNIWAPWRMKYILGEKPSHCIFCQMPQEGRDRDNLILHRRENTYVIMNRFPYNNGHLMVLPFIHVSTLEGLAPELMREMMELTQYSVDCLKKEFRPEGFNIGINLGKVAGAGIEEHLHVHIVPRWVGDVSFMSVLDDVRVIPEHVLESYDRLYPVFNSNA